LYAGADESVVEGMDAFGRRLGVAFQLIDDLLGIWGDPAQTGKPVGSDLAARKKTLPVVAALHSGTPAATELAKIYAIGRPLTEDELKRAADAVHRAGGRECALAAAEEQLAKAHRLLAEALPDLSAAGDLLAVADLVTHRDR
jgi:geranylgeranyl diphosphate synthase type I